AVDDGDTAIGCRRDINPVATRRRRQGAHSTGKLDSANWRKILCLYSNQAAVDREINAISHLRTYGTAGERQHGAVLNYIVGRPYLPDQSLRPFVSSDDQVASRLREHRPRGNGRLEVPVATRWIEANNFT